MTKLFGHEKRQKFQASASTSILNSMFVNRSQPEELKRKVLKYTS